MAGRSYIPERPAPTWLALGAPLVFVGLAWALRTILAGLVGSEVPYTLFVGAVIASAYAGGWLGGILAALLGGAVAEVSFVGGLGFNFRGTNLWGLVVFIVFSGALVAAEEALFARIRREIRLNEELSLLSRELRHRIRNLLGMTEAISQQTRRSTSNLEEFHRKFASRLRALFSAQDLIDGDGDAEVPLDFVVSGALAPFLTQERLVAPIAGPPVTIARDLVAPVTLILNELATNATKYGALSIPDGLLRIAWTVDQADMRLSWQEIGGPSVRPPEKAGFGTTLLKAAMPRSKGSVALSFDPDGLLCEIRIFGRPRSAASNGRTAEG